MDDYRLFLKVHLRAVTAELQFRCLVLYCEHPRIIADLHTMKQCFTSSSIVGLTLFSGQEAEKLRRQQKPGKE